MSDTLSRLAQRILVAAPVVNQASTAQKNSALLAAAQRLQAAGDAILVANTFDVAHAQEQGATTAVIDRLQLNHDKLAAMAQGLVDVAALEDPVGVVTRGWRRPNGLNIRQVRVPLGVVGIIYENRPNVTSDAFALCLKSGNAAFLRGSSGAIQSNIAIAGALRNGLVDGDLPADSMILVEDVTREGAVAFMRQRGVIDCLIPRGGKSLIESILANATVPYVIDGDGNCHVYVDKAADFPMALNIVVNAKTHRTSVCNAAESLVVHVDVADEFLVEVVRAMPMVTFVGDERACQILGDRCALATVDDFGSEFLDYKMSIAVVDDLDGAIRHIRRYSTGHSEAIVTADFAAANRFVAEVDAAAVLVNASTRFVDGGEFGFGAEIGISTQKLHARGPMGLTELTTQKYIIEGNGHIRS